MLQSFEMEDINNFHLSGKLNILDYDTPPSLQPERYAVQWRYRVKAFTNISKSFMQLSVVILATNCCIRGWIPLHIPNPDPTENNSFEIFETSGGLRRGEAVWLEAGGRGEGTGEIFNKKILFMILEQFKKIFTILFFLILGRKNAFLWYTCFMILFFTDTFFYDTLHVS